MAMADGRADLAVHSLKDVPMDMPEGFTLAAISRARGSARRVRIESTISILAELPGGARVGTSSLRREAQLRERDPLLGVAAAARQRQHAAAQARRRPIRRDHPCRRGVEAAGLRRTASPRCSIRRRACRRRARVRSRSNAAPIAPTSSPRSRRSPIATRRLRPPPSAPSRARCRAAATRRSRRTRVFGTSELWLRGLLASRDGARSDARRASGSRSPTSVRAEALGRELADDFLARGAARLVTGR